MSEKFTDKQILEAYFATVGHTESDSEEWEASVITEMHLRRMAQEAQESEA